MEYCDGGEVFSMVAAKGRLSERAARRLFRQLVSGVAACHAVGVAHRDLKLENTLLAGTGGGGGDGGGGSGGPSAEGAAGGGGGVGGGEDADAARRWTLKIADFGYSKSLAGDSGPPISRVGTPSYIAPEILMYGGGGGGGGGGADEEGAGPPAVVGYDGRAADVWSLGVFLYVLVVGAYPFEPPVARAPSPAAARGQSPPHQPPPPPRNVVEVVRRILAAKYSYPPGSAPSALCRDLIARVLVPDPRRRLPLEAVRAHPWFLGIGVGVGEEADDPLPADVAESPALAVARARARESGAAAAVGDGGGAGVAPVMQSEADVREVVARARRGPEAVVVAADAMAAVVVAAAAAESKAEGGP
jgi:serine/threonine protein kinase